MSTFYALNTPKSHLVCAEDTVMPPASGRGICECPVRITLDAEES